jgi:hypothetical protein
MRRFVLVFFAAVLCLSAADSQRVPIDQFLIGGDTVKDPDAPVSVKLPAGWELLSAMRWGIHETTLAFLDQKTGQIVSLYYQFPIQVLYPNDPEAFLLQGMNSKVKQRQKEDRLVDYRIREGSVRKMVIDQHPSLSFVGDYTGRIGAPMVEFMLRVLSRTMKANFFMMQPGGAPTEETLVRLDALVQTLNIP